MDLFRRRASGPHADEPFTVERLTPDIARSLRLPLFSRFSNLDLTAAVDRNPELSLVNRRTRQYALGSHWRRREEIGEIVEASHGPARDTLVSALIERFAESGAQLVVLDFDEGGGNAAFYARHGFKIVDRIVEYEIDAVDVMANGKQHGSRTVRRGNTDDLNAILAIERDSFPWLWWNSLQEIEAYSASLGVEVFVAFSGSVPVGYAGITARGPAGHLDRLAVRNGEQGKGYGGSLLSHCLNRFSALGVRRVTLTTQEENTRSRSLYERFGFRRGAWSYDIRGLWIGEPR